MFKSVLNNFRKLVGAPPVEALKPSKATVSPAWFAEGRKAALKFKGKPQNAEKALKKNFKNFHYIHLYACKLAKAKPDEPYRCFDKFKDGWNEQLTKSSKK